MRRGTLVTVGSNGLTFIPGIILKEGGWKPGEAETLSDIGADHLSMWDYNNDGLLDAVTWSEEGVQIYMGDLNDTLVFQPELASSLSERNSWKSSIWIKMVTRI